MATQNNNQKSAFEILSGKKILWVEDDPFLSSIIAKKFSGLNCILLCASNGQEALRLAEEETPDIVMLDILLSGMDGFEILSRIKEHPKGALIPVVVLTTSKHQKEINKAYELGASSFVTKSENFSELAAKLNSVNHYWLKTVEMPALGDEK